jgi:hypothetical protein
MTSSSKYIGMDVHKESISIQQKPRRRVRCRERLGGLLRYHSYVA